MIEIIMPHYEQQWSIGAAIYSVLAQDCDPAAWSMVIVDDGSPSGLDAPARAPVVSLPINGGTANAINAGAGHYPDAEWRTWISSDNIMAPDWLSTLLEHANDDAGALYGGFYYQRGESGTFNTAGKRRYLFEKHQPNKLINTVNCYYGPAFLIRREVWDEAGPHRGKISHDYDHWLRVEEACWRMGLRIVGVDKPLCTYWAHPRRATVVRKDEFDAHHWQEEARKRRNT